MSEKKAVVSVLGEDGPGIVYDITKVLSDRGCRILEISQTILQTEFAGIFVVSMPEPLTKDVLRDGLDEELNPRGLNVNVKDFRMPAAPWNVESEPFVITLRGRDQVGIIPEFSGVIAGFEVNIENLKAIALPDDPGGVVLAFEVAVPKVVHQPAFREALKFKSDELGLEMSLQHRDIFEAIHRIW